MKSISKKLLNIHLLFYLVWPFGSLLYSFKNLNKDFYVILILVSLFYGYTLQYQGGSDMERYIEYFHSMSNMSHSSLLMAYSSGDYSDYYTITVTYLVSIFTDNYRTYTAIISLIFSFFYALTIREIILQNFLINRKYNILYSLFIFILFFYVSIFYINSLRFYTAFYVFFYSFLQIYYKQKNWFFLLAFLTPLIHVAFAAVVGFLILFYFFSKNRIVCLIIVLISFLFQPNIDFTKYASNETVRKKITGYTTEEGIYSLNKSLDLTRLYASEGLIIFNFIKESHFYFLLASLLIILFSPQIRYAIDIYDKRLINVNLLFLALVNVLNDFGEGYRYNYIFGFFLIITYFKISSLSVTKHSLSLKYLLIIFIIGISIFVLSFLYVQIRSLSIEFVLTNWIYVLISM